MAYPRLSLEDLGAKGLGLVTRAPLQAGDFILEYVGECLRTRPRTSHYCLQVSKDLWLDSQRKGNIARFINHSCDPNMRCETWTSVDGQPLIGFFAAVDIAVGQEITMDYGKDFAIEDCLCDSVDCRQNESLGDPSEDFLELFSIVQEKANELASTKRMKTWAEERKFGCMIRQSSFVWDAAMMTGLGDCLEVEDLQYILQRRAEYQNRLQEGN